MSIRKIVKQQFSEGTTVDGDRLDQALQDTQEYINSVPPGDLGVRYTQTQIVAGWTPLQGVANTPADRQSADGDIAHPYRVNGTTTNQIAWAAPGNPTKWVWTTTLYIENPVVLDALDMMFNTYPNAAATPGMISPTLDFFDPASSDWLDGGLQVTVSVADPQATEEPIRNSLVLQLKDLYMGAEHLGQDLTVYAAPIDNILPTTPDFPPSLTDCWLQRRGIQLHIPSNSRVSFVVVLDGLSVTTPLNAQSYQRGNPNLVITLLEPIEP